MAKESRPRPDDERRDIREQLEEQRRKYEKSQGNRQDTEVMSVEYCPVHKKRFAKGSQCPDCV
jgi:DNA-binding MarR family transcriptional regulator